MKRLIPFIFLLASTAFAQVNVQGTNIQIGGTVAAGSVVTSIDGGGGPLNGAVVFSCGTGLTCTQVGQTITVTGTGGGTITAADVANAISGTIGGSANAITLALTTTSAAFGSGAIIDFIPTANNTGAATLAISPVASKPITKCGATALVAGDLVSGVLAIVGYDGTRYQLNNPQAVGCNGAVGSGTVTTVSVATANGFQGTVANPTTTPAITMNVDSSHVLPTNTGSSSTFLNGAGAYTTPSGSGNTTSTSLSSNKLPKANGANSIIDSSVSDDGTTVSTTEAFQAASGTFVGSGPPITIPANKATSPSAGTGQFGTDASGDLVKSDNNAAQIRVTGTSASGSANNCVKFAANGIDISDAGVTCTGGFTAAIKYVSQTACNGTTDMNVGGGTDETACLNAILATATPTAPVVLYQDQTSLISGNGLQIPPGGNVAILGNGGGIANTNITNCTIGGGQATFVTTVNDLVVGQWVRLNSFESTCGAILNGNIYQVLSSGLTTTGFEVTQAGTVSSVAENATAKTVFGTGFYFASGSTGDVISNGAVGPTNCDIPGGPVPSQGSNVLLENFVINGNYRGNGQYCFGADLNNLTNVTIQNVVFYDTLKYSLKTANVSQVVVTGNKFITSNLGGGTNTDGIHVEGPSSNWLISDNYFQTGDDALALNAVEGYCGPLTNFEISNNIVDNSFNAIRMYNDALNVCSSNTLVPQISNIDVDNLSGSVYANVATFGNGTQPGTLPQAITNVHWHNSNITVASGATPGTILFLQNVGDITFSNFNLTQPNGTALFTLQGSTLNTHIINMDSLTLDNVSIQNPTSSGGGNQIFSNNGNNTNGFHLGVLSINGFRYENIGSGTGSMPCLLCYTQSGGALNPFAIDQVNASNINYNNIGVLTDNSLYPVSTGVKAISGQFRLSRSFSGSYPIASPTTPYLGVWASNSAYTQLGFDGGYGTTTLGIEGDPVSKHMRFDGPTGADYTFLVNGTQAVKIDSTGCVAGCAGLPQVTSLISGSGGANSAGISILSSGGTLPTNVLGIVGVQSANTLNTYYDGSNWVYQATGPVGAYRLFANGSQTAYQMSLGASGSGNFSGMDTTAVTQFCISGTNNQCWFNPQSVTPTFPSNAALVVNPSANFYVKTTGDAIQASGTVHSWNSDTGLSRDSAGVVDVGNGTAGDKSGVLELSRIIFNSTTPALSSCGAATISGNNNAFAIQSISTTSCTVTFSANIQGVCTANAWNSTGPAATTAVPASSSTVLTLTMGAGTTDANVICF